MGKASMAAKAPPTDEDPGEEKQKREPLQVGKTSIIVDGKEIIFARGQKELPGMPEISRLRALAEGYAKQAEEIEEEQKRLNDIRQNIVMELKNEGRTEFAFRMADAIHLFTIVPTDEKLKVKKK